MNRCPLRFLALLSISLTPAFFSPACAQTLQRRPPADYSAEPFVVERISHEFHFDNDGTYDQQTSVRVRLQSPAGVQAWGLIRVPYASSSGDVEIANVQVSKPDGTSVSTSQDNVQDMPAQITVAAPFYSDLKEKQLAVRGLAVGDTLEYEYAYRVRTPLIPGQFWYSHSFFDQGIVLSDELTIRVSAGRAVKIKSSKVQPTRSQTTGYELYKWKTAHLVAAKQDDPDKPAAAEPEIPDVQVSSFNNWSEVADWYAKLQESRIVPEAEVRAKAEELTRNAVTDEQKIRALYDYVALKFRYVGIAFGLGRYQPHSAGDVLANGYGDCKDKHTLLAALLASVGIKAYPALISSAGKIDAEVPSPGQFNHMITVVPQGGALVWLDTTPEVAPFGLLIPALRDKDALVVSGPGSKLIRSPVNPPFRSAFTFRMTGKMSEAGTLQAKAAVVLKGDVEVDVRRAFRSAPQAQWKDVVQLFSQAWNFGGTVSDVDVSSPESTGDTITLAYAYERKSYPRWPDGLGMPLPPVNIAALPDDSNKLDDPLILDAPGDFQLDALIELPNGFSPRLRPTVDVTKDFAEYHASYKLESGVLHAERRLAILKRDIPKSRAEEYRAFWKVVDDDGDTVLSLVSSAAAGAGNASVAEQLNLGDVLLYQDDYDGAAVQYKKALQQEPDNFRAHLNLGKVLYYKQDYDDAMTEYREALRLRPNDADAHSFLANVLVVKKDLNSAVAEYRTSIRLRPDDALAHSNLADTLSGQRNWDASKAEFEEALRLDPNNAQTHLSYGQMLSAKGDAPAGLAEYREALRLDPGDSYAHETLAAALYRSRDYDGAIAEFRVAAQLDPKSSYAAIWLAYSYMAKRDYDAAIAAAQRALTLEPDDPDALGFLADALRAKGDVEGAIAAYHNVMRLNNPEAVKMGTLRLSTLLMSNKRYSEAISELQNALQKVPEDAELLLNLGVVEVRGGKTQDALADFEKAVTISRNPVLLNNVAYELADSNVLLDSALGYGLEAVAAKEKDSADIELGILQTSDLRLMGSLASYWDTLGWIYFRQEKLAEAEKFLAAAWKLRQDVVVGDHLGQVYEKRGNRQEAAHSYALALAVPGAASNSATRDRLVALTGTPAKAEEAIRTAAGELSDQRTVRLSRMTKGPARAEFFLLFTPDAGPVGVRFISGSEDLRNAGDAVIAAHYDVRFPDDHPAKIIRRGILNCPATGASCQFILLPIESVTSVN